MQRFIAASWKTSLGTVAIWLGFEAFIATRSWRFWRWLFSQGPTSFWASEAIRIFHLGFFHLPVTQHKAADLSCSCYLHVSGLVSIWGKEIERMMLWVKPRGEKVLVVLNMISARSMGVTLSFSVKLEDLVSKCFCCSYEQSQVCSPFQRRVWAGAILYDVFVN